MKKTLKVKKLIKNKLNGGKLNDVSTPKINIDEYSNIKIFFNLVY